MRCPLSSLLSRFLQSLGDGPGAAPRPGAVRQGEQREHAAKGGQENEMNGVFFFTTRRVLLSHLLSPFHGHPGGGGQAEAIAAAVHGGCVV